jgi:hypothetical protein
LINEEAGTDDGADDGKDGGTDGGTDGGKLSLRMRGSVINSRLVSGLAVKRSPSAS